MYWVEIKTNNGKIDKATLPESTGKYIVETKTMMGNRNRFETSFNGEKFNFSNQTVLRWLKED